MFAQLQSKPHRFWVVCTVAASIAFALDQATKLYAERVHLIAPPVPSMANHRASAELFWSCGERTSSHFVFEITHVANAGVILGLLEEMPEPIPWLSFMIPTCIALAGSAWLLHRSSAMTDTLWIRIGSITLLTGVLANLLDRVRLHYVVDWLHLKWKIIGWAVDAPAFNFADLYIIGGSCIVALAIARGWLTGFVRIRTPDRST